MFDPLVIGGYYLDFTARGLVANTGIAVRDGRIVAVDANPTDCPAAITLQLDECDTILPGLVDLHAHYNVRLIRKRREEFDVMPVVYLANGATTTFTAGEYDPEGMDSLRRRRSGTTRR